jgi:predicted DNA repair protein MutK
MLAVAVFITVAVYGFVGFIVKADDIGVYLARKKNSTATQKFGRGIVKFMPHFLTILGYVGTAAMIWVGAEIIAHGIPFTSHLLHDLEHALAKMPALAWFAKALACAIAGLIIGFVVEKIVVLVKKVFSKKNKAQIA